MGSNPTPSAKHALVAQLVEVAVLEAVQCRFESYREHQTWKGKPIGDGTGLENQRAKALGVRIHPPSANMDGQANGWWPLFRKQLGVTSPVGVRLPRHPPEYMLW